MDAARTASAGATGTAALAQLASAKPASTKPSSTPAAAGAALLRDAPAPTEAAATDTKPPATTTKAPATVVKPASETVAARISEWSGSSTDSSPSTDAGSPGIATRVSSFLSRTIDAGSGTLLRKSATDTPEAQAIVGDGDVVIEGPITATDPADSSATSLDAAVPEDERGIVESRQPDPPSTDPAYWEQNPYFVGEDGTVYYATYDPATDTLTLTRTGDVVAIEGGGQVTRDYEGTVDQDGTAVISWSGTGTNAEGAPLAEDGVRIEYVTGDSVQEIVREDTNGQYPRRTFIRESDIQGVESSSSSALTVTRGTLDAPIEGELVNSWRQESTNSGYREVVEGSSRATMRSTDGDPFDPWDASDPNLLPEEVTVHEGHETYTVTALDPAPDGTYPTLVTERRLAKPYSFRMGGLQEQPEYQYRTNGSEWQSASTSGPWMGSEPVSHVVERSDADDYLLFVSLGTLVPGPVGLGATVYGELLTSFGTAQESATAFGVSKAGRVGRRAGTPLGAYFTLSGLYDTITAPQGHVIGTQRGMYLTPGWVQLAPPPAENAFIPRHMLGVTEGYAEPTIELDDSNGDSEISVRGVGDGHENGQLRMRVEDGQVQVLGDNGQWVNVASEGSVRFSEGTLSWTVRDGELVVVWTDIYGNQTAAATGGVDQEPVGVQGSAEGAEQASDMVLTRRER